MSRKLLFPLTQDGSLNTIFSEENIRAINLESISKNLSSYISPEKQKPTVMIDKAGPSLNLKILGSEDAIIFDCDFLLAFPLVSWPSTAEVKTFNPQLMFQFCIYFL